MRATVLVALLAVPVVVGVLACGESELPPGVVARIGGHSLGLSDFESYVLEATGESGHGFEAAVLAGLFRQFLEEELLLRLAIDRGQVGEAASRRTAARALLAIDPPQIDEDAVARYRDQHREEIALPERLVVRHMLFEGKTAAEAARQLLLAGQAFDSVAGDAVGAELLEVAFEDLPEAYAAALFELQPGEVSEVLGNGYQFHVFKAVSRLPAGDMPPAQLRAKIARELQDRAVAERRLELLAEAWQRYNVVVARSRLPFDVGALEQNPDTTG